MRVASAEAMLRIADEHPGLITLGTDGASAFEGIARRTPGRYVDVGIAEANGVGVAAGLARCGFKVAMTAIASFLVRRACEQIRVDVVEPGLDVTFIGHGAGLSYGTLGSTHHIVEDIAVFSAMPTVGIYAPSDFCEIEWALAQAIALDGPAYVRLPTTVVPALHEVGADTKFQNPVVIRNGDDVGIVGIGGCATEAARAAIILSQDGMQARVITVPSIRPLPQRGLHEALSGLECAVVVEDHSVGGGLGSAVIRAIGVESTKLRFLGIDERRAPVGTQEDLFQHYSVDSAAIAEACRELIAVSSDSSHVISVSANVSP